MAEEVSPARLYGIVFSVAFAIGIIVTGLTAWILMLLLGAVHSFAEWVPALGYWQTVLVILLVRVVTAVIKSVKA